MSWPARLLAVPVYFYRWVVSPLLPKSCRFEPSCSTYALEALNKHGAFYGGWLTFRRVIRCHPFGGSGFDPVPEPGAVRRSGRRGLQDATRAQDRCCGRHLEERGDHG